MFENTLKIESRSRLLSFNGSETPSSMVLKDGTLTVVAHIVIDSGQISLCFQRRKGIVSSFHIHLQ